MPGYTHLQRAQPVYLSHHLLAYFWKFRRDLQRFNFCLNATEDLPLGAGAIAGVNFDTSRMSVAQDLGFGAIAENSMDAVSNRDFVLDYLSAAATCATHLSQLGAEIVLWSSEEFGFAQVADEWASGSSLMPQKRNPDAAELLRAKAPRISAHLVALHGVLQGLPLTYNKDMQEDKEHLFDAVDTLELCLAAATEMLRGLRFDRDRMAAASADEFLAATDVADLLVRRGVPFRESHSIVASLVRTALESGKGLSDLSEKELEELAPQLDGEFYELLRGGCLARIEVLGGRHGPGLGARPARPGPARAGRGLELSGAQHPGGATDPRGREFYERSVHEVARDLVGCVVRHGKTAGRIVETESYHETEPACHAFVGLTAAHRSAVRQARDDLRVPLVRHPRAAERRGRGERHRRSGADQGARTGRWRRADACAARPRARGGAVLRPRKAHPGARDRPGVEREPPARRAAHDRAAAGRPASARDRPPHRNHEGSRPALALLRRGSVCVSRPWPASMRERRARAA